MNMTERDYEEIAERVAQKMKTEKYSKSTFHKIIDEFNDNFAEISKDEHEIYKAKESITALAKIHFNMGKFPSRFQTEKADELRKFIRNALDVIKSNSNKEVT